ncbi:hypothetical protein GCM10022206_01590 [Streptomyces chiangmaiensis]
MVAGEVVVDLAAADPAREALGSEPVDEPAVGAPLARVATYGYRSFPDQRYAKGYADGYSAGYAKAEARYCP